MRLIGTAGHIDHGKSTLVHALTGIHPSRLPEEQARGMTIDLGYAWLDHPDGGRLGIVDVPGHERLVRNMVAGATGFELALWVVDARESVMPQSREHLAILELLGVRSLLPVVTKADVADAGQLAATRADVLALLAGASVPVQPVHVVDSLSGRGIDGLRQAVIDACRGGDEGRDDLPYLPVDRVFSLKGIGTVVTGTLARGRLAEGDPVAMGSRPGTWRIRSLANHHQRVGEAGAGQRVGVNLVGLGPDEVRRGDVLVSPGHPYRGRFLNARLRWVDGAPAEWKHGARLLFHAGCTETECRVWGVEQDGPDAWGQVELRGEMCFHPGQRFILRGTSPLATVGGGEVMDLAPDRPRRVTGAERSAYAPRARGEPSLASYLAASPQPVVDVAALARRWMMRDADVLAQAEGGGELRAGTGKGASLAWRAGAGADLLGRLRSFVASQPRAQQIVSFDRLGRELRVRTALLEPWLHALWAVDGADAAYLRAHARLDRAGLVVHSGTVSFTPEEQRLAGRIVERLREKGIRPARLREFESEYGARAHLVERVIAKLAEQGRVVRVSPDFALAAEAADALHAAAASLPREGVTAAGFGQALGLSRKYSIPYLEYLNGQGILRREGDLHLPA